MKNTSIIAALFLFLAVTRAESEVNIALKGGPDAATQTEDFRVHRYGFSGGLSGDLQWPLTDRFLLATQLDLLYTPRGSEVVFEGENVGRSREHYFDLMVALRPGVRLGRMSGYLLLGGGVNLLVSANKDDAAGMGQDITDALRRFDVALLGGAGIALHLSRQGVAPLHFSAIFLEARYDIGLLDTDTVNGGFKNRTAALMLGLSFVVAGQPGQPGQPASAMSAGHSD